jgi:hypothetical protein
MYSWNTLITIILCIAICIALLLLFKWGKKKIDEGFQTSPEYLTHATGTYHGTTNRISTAPSTSGPVNENEISTNVILFVLTSRLSVPFKFKVPVEIWTTTKVAEGFMFSYNYPILAIHAKYDSNNLKPWIVRNELNNTGIKWSSSSSFLPKSTVYTFRTLFCDIEENKENDKCLIQNLDTFLPPERAIEQTVYDNYEIYGIDPSPEPVKTTVKKYDMSSELASFDFGAPVPWDYDNRMFDPNDVVWGSIHDYTSKMMLTTAYNLEVFKSLNNLEYDENEEWSYTIPIFEKTWGPENEKYEAEIQFLEFLATTGIGMIVEGGYSAIEDSFSEKSNKQIDNLTNAKASEKSMFKALRSEGVPRKEAAKFSKEFGNEVFNTSQKMSKTLSDTEINDCDSARTNSLASTEGNSSMTKSQKMLQAETARINTAETKIEANTKRVGAPNVDVKTSGSARVLKGIDSIDVKLPKTAGVVSKMKKSKIGSAILRLIGKGSAAKLAAKTAGKIASNLANKLGVVFESQGILGVICLALYPPLPVPPYVNPGLPFCLTVASVINVFIGIFTLGCATFIPAILSSYIPDDAVCPAGSFNIRDAMTQLPGGALGWEIISNIPGFGDGLSAFGPYLCSKMETSPSGIKYLGEVVLKKPRVAPGYFYDSTLSLYCDINKAAMSPDEPSFNDVRKYVTNALTGNAIKNFPYWQSSGIPPVWVDFSDKTMLNKMANFYYKNARRLSESNYDGTYSFEYISKFYGVIASSELSCDVQCEITKITYYANSGSIQSKYIVPVDPENGTTYHDRRFYFYEVQVPSVDTKEAAVSDADKSIFAMQELMERKETIVFLTNSQRREYVVSSSETNLNRLVTDNINRYIVTGCTHVDGTAPAAYEVNKEGSYVGDALVSLGEGAEYYSPEINIDEQIMKELSSAITEPINLSPISNNEVKVFTYNNKLIVFTRGDTVKVSLLNSDSTTNNSVYFNGEVTQFVTSFNTSTVSIKVTSINGTIPSESKNYSISVNTRSSSTAPPLNDGCNVVRSRAFKYGQNMADPEQGSATPRESYIITTPSSNPTVWNGFRNSAKIWIESDGGEMKSQADRDAEIIQGTATGAIASYVNFSNGFPIGAVFTGVLGFNFAGSSSANSLMACLYQDAMKSLGTYVMNGKVFTIQEGQNNRYLNIDRGPIIPFAPGYTPDIKRDVIDLLQSDCINRSAIRRAVKLYNDTNNDMPITKVINITTDNNNKKCGYLVETKSLRTNEIANKMLLLGYAYSNRSGVPNLAYVSDNTIRVYTINPNGTSTPALPNIGLQIRSTDFSIAPSNDTYIQITNENENNMISRKYRRNAAASRQYTCDSAEIKDRLIVQFNKKNEGAVRIKEITASYYPSVGKSLQADQTAICAYSTTIEYVKAPGQTEVKGIKMVLTPANDSNLALYDLLYDNYPSYYRYPNVPKEGRPILVPPPLVNSKNILRTGCINVSMSTCADTSIINNVVTQFNKQVVNDKIFKVRKAYTPLIGTSTICDYEVEMHRRINDTSTIVNKENIRVKIKESVTDSCLWDLDLVGSNAPAPNSGTSIADPLSVTFLENQYIWAPSFLTSIRQSINDAILDYLNIDVKNILSNNAKVVNKEVKSLYENIMTSQNLYHPTPTCKIKCRDRVIIQSIIDRYNTDNYPTQQYGAQHRSIESVRRVGTYDSNTCQVEFIEKIDTYANLISSPINVDNISDPNVIYNSRYYLRQYEFKTNPLPNTCGHTISNIRQLILNGRINEIDISGGAIALESDVSKVSEAESASYNYSTVVINCLHPTIISKVKSKYDTSFPISQTSGGTPKYNSLKAFSTSFNSAMNTCEYTVNVNKWFRGLSGSLYQMNNINVTLKAQWDSYDINNFDYLTTSPNTTPSLLVEYDPSKIIPEKQVDNTYKFKNEGGTYVDLPYTYKLPLNYDRNRVSTCKILV